MNTWITYASREFPFTLRYPHFTPGGFRVAIDVKTAAASRRAHFSSPGSDEVYFEVGRYQNVGVQEAIEAFIDEACQSLDCLEVGELDETQFASLPAYQLSLSWPGRERRVVFVDDGEAVYRIIHDPSSTINKMMLSSFRFA